MTSTVTLGVLECDHVGERNRAIAGDYTDMFTTLFAAHAPRLELVPVDVIGGELPDSVHECDAWLITGSRYSVYDDDQRGWIDPLAELVRGAHDAAVPVAGICFGHQLLAQALGGEVARAASGWGAGILDVAVERTEPWMQPPADCLALHFMHQDQVVVPPPGAVVLGRAAHCPVAMMAVGPTTVGVQPHPEFVPAYTDVLLAARVDRIGADAVAAARARLTRPTDEGTVARWLAAVLARGC